MIDQADYAVWRDNFGATLATASSSSANCCPYHCKPGDTRANGNTVDASYGNRTLGVRGCRKSALGSLRDFAASCGIAAGGRTSARGAHSTSPVPRRPAAGDHHFYRHPPKPAALQITGSDHGLNTPTSDLATGNIPWGRD